MTRVICVVRARSKVYVNARVLHKLLNALFLLLCTCLKKQMCKVFFPCDKSRSMLIIWNLELFHVICINLWTECLRVFFLLTCDYLYMCVLHSVSLPWHLWRNREFCLSVWSSAFSTSGRSWSVSATVPPLYLSERRKDTIKIKICLMCHV